jgi:hypothetical protein
VLFSCIRSRRFLANESPAFFRFVEQPTQIAGNASPHFDKAGVAVAWSPVSALIVMHLGYLRSQASGNRATHPDVKSPPMRIWIAQPGPERTVLTYVSLADLA